MFTCVVNFLCFRLHVCAFVFIIIPCDECSVYFRMSFVYLYYFQLACTMLVGGARIELQLCSLINRKVCKFRLAICMHDGAINPSDVDQSLVHALGYRSSLLVTASMSAVQKIHVGELKNVFAASVLALALYSGHIKESFYDK